MDLTRQMNTSTKIFVKKINGFCNNIENMIIVEYLQTYRLLRKKCKYLVPEVLLFIYELSLKNLLIFKFNGNKMALLI